MGDDLKLSADTLIGLCKNPNTGAVLVIGLGCEGIRADKVADEIKKTGKPVEVLVIQEHGGTLGAMREGLRIAGVMARDLSGQRRTPFPLSEIILGLECGGSDPTSGLAANPVIGECSNQLIAKGGSCVLSETTEMIGAEHLLASRAVTKDIGSRFLEMVKNMENKAINMGLDLRGTQPTPGNIASGITTIEEKSLGCIYKSGNAPLQGVVDFAMDIPKNPKGLYYMDTPGEDLCSVTGMVAGGSQLTVFSTGLGTPTGHPIAPIIKITGNDETYRKMLDNIDFNAGTVITRGETIAEKGRELLDMVVEVCNGKLTKAEILGHREFGLYRIGFTF
jgi:altronate dehydratase large subunit